MPDLNISRLDIPKWCATQGADKVAVEVGTYRGVYADHWCTTCPGVLHCVDPWTHQADWADMLNHDQPTMEQVYVEACERLAPHTAAKRCVIHRTGSVTASQMVWAHDLDVVYLDARPDFPSVMLDLVAWFPKVRKRGIIGGHDFLDATHGDTVFGVKPAVEQFFRGQGYDLDTELLIVRDGSYPSWLVRVR